MIKTCAIAATAVLATLAGGNAWAADPLPTESHKVLTAALALEAAQAAVAACKQQGYNVTVTIVDRTGEPKLILVGDGARPLTLEVTRRKAYTSAMQRISTARLHQAGLHAGRFQSRPVRQRAHHRSGRPADQGRRGHDRRHLGCRRSRRRQGRSLRQRRPRQDQRSAEVAFRNT